MRISDWSSDVCSSDLPRGAAHQRRIARDLNMHAACFFQRIVNGMKITRAIIDKGDNARHCPPNVPLVDGTLSALRGSISTAVRSARATALKQLSRSEEHTSELQSLMRISYAVFCL